MHVTFGRKDCCVAQGAWLWEFVFYTLCPYCFFVSGFTQREGLTVDLLERREREEALRSTLVRES